MLVIFMSNCRLKQMLHFMGDGKFHPDLVLVSFDSLIVNRLDAGNFHSY